MLTCVSVCEGLACVCGLADSLCDAFWVLSLHTFRRSRSPQQSGAEAGTAGRLCLPTRFWSRPCLLANVYKCLASSDSARLRHRLWQAADGSGDGDEAGAARPQPLNILI